MRAILWCDVCEIPFQDGDDVLDVIKRVDVTGFSPTGMREYAEADVQIHAECDPHNPNRYRRIAATSPRTSL